MTTSDRILAETCFINNPECGNTHRKAYLVSIGASGNPEMRKTYATNVLNMPKQANNSSASIS